MKNDITPDDPADMAVTKKLSPDEAMADPVAVVLLLQREAGHRQQRDMHSSKPLRQVKIRERVLRRMLETSLENTGSVKKPRLKIVK